jgi:hypothetical protein
VQTDALPGRQPTLVGGSSMGWKCLRSGVGPQRKKVVSVPARREQVLYAHARRLSLAKSCTLLAVCGFYIY